MQKMWEKLKQKKWHRTKIDCLWTPHCERVECAHKMSKNDYRHLKRIIPEFSVRSWDGTDLLSNEDTDLLKPHIEKHFFALKISTIVKDVLRRKP